MGLGEQGRALEVELGGGAWITGGGGGAWITGKQGEDGA